MKRNQVKPELRTATIDDFKVGTVLIDTEGYEHIIANKYMDGIWDTRSSNCVFEDNAQYYRVKISNHANH